MLQGQAKNQKLGYNGCKDESQIHTQGLSNHSILEDAEFEIEVDVSERIH
jgi:hypothetical protein